MAYDAKLDWQTNEIVGPDDLKRIEQGIKDVDTNKLDKTANAVSATKLQTPRTIGISGAVTGAGVNFDGSQNININVTEVDATKLKGTATVNTTGNAGTATKLVAKRKIALTGAVTGTATEFDGSADINIPVTSVNPDNFSKAVPVSKGGTGKTTIGDGNVLVGNGTDVMSERGIDTTEGGTANSTYLITSGAVRAGINKKLDATANAVSASKLQTPRSIAISGGATGTATSFDGTGNISIPVTALNPDVLSKVVPVNKGGTGVTNLTVSKLKRDINSDTVVIIYLSPTGNDNNDGSSSSVPMKSIRAAVGKYGGLNRLELRLASGTYTDSDTVSVSGNAYVNIVGNGSRAEDVVITHGIIFQSNDAKVTKVTFDLTNSSLTMPGLTFRQAKYDIQNCIFNGKPSVHAGINASLGSTGYVIDCYFLNVIRATEIGAGASMTVIQSTIDSTVNIGFNVNGGMLVSNSNTNNATTKFTMYNSAVIFNNGSLLNPLGTLAVASVE